MEKMFFDESLNGFLRKLVEQNKLNEDERIVVNYHLAGLSNDKIRLILGRSHQQFLFIEQDVLEKIERLKHGNGAPETQPEPREPINITLATCDLTDDELFIVKCRLEQMNIKDVTKKMCERLGKRIGEERVKEIERNALSKLQHPTYRVQRRVVRKKTTAPK
ncbi:MAG: hypothetical protein FWE16_04760 [Firmicutes bacterium]|nr:hypothetical protein [Bacillota bacterium]